MIKKLLSASLILAGLSVAKAQSFSLYYPFSSVASGSASTGPVDPTPAPSATGVLSGSWSAVGTGTAPSTSGVFSFNGWGTGATNGNNATFTGSVDVAKYYELTIIPATNYMVSLTNMSFGASRSGTGVRHWAVRTNRDSYTANTAATYTPLNAAATASSAPLVQIQNGDTFFWKDDAFNTGTTGSGFANNNICNVNFSGANFTNQTTPYIIRVYAWNAEAGTGTFRIDSVVVNGSASMTTGFGKLTHDLNAKIKLYPNPSHDGVVTLESTANNVSKIEVINILGAVVASQNVATEEKIKLDLSTLPQGTYFVRTKAGEKLITEKLVITK